jgi:o-succinylbenzoate synthase
MRLRSVEVIPYALPFREPYVTARGTLTRREMVLLRLTDEEGVVGLGEAVPLSLRGGARLEQVVGELEQLAAGDVLAPYFEHGTFEITSVEEIDPRLKLSPPARCALLTAIGDLLERSLDYRPERTHAIACNATLVAGEPSAVAASAREWAESGFSTFKLKLGAGDDVALVRAVREAVGPEASIRVDSNASWSLSTAIRMLAELEPFDIELVEQPVASIEDAALLARTSSIPLAGDESVNTPEEAREAAQAGAFEVTGIKLSKVGGYYEGMGIAEALPAYVSSALDGPVGIAVSGHLAESLDHDGAALGRRRFAHGLATQRLFASTIASVECELRDGHLHLPPGPGLGIEIDEDALAAHRL